MKNRILRTVRASVSCKPLQFPAAAHSQISGVATHMRDLFTASWKWLRQQQQSRVRAKRLHLEETISLGQKRFVALITVDGNRLLLGGGAAEVALLANLDADEPFSNILQQTSLAPIPAPAKRTRKRTAKSKPEPEKCA